MTVVFPESLTILGVLGNPGLGSFYPQSSGGQSGGFLTLQNDGENDKLGLYFITNVAAQGGSGIAYCQKTYDGDYINGWEEWNPSPKLQVPPVESGPSETQTDTPGFLHVPSLTANPYLMFHQVDPGDRPEGEGGTRSGIQVAHSTVVNPNVRTWTRNGTTYTAKQGATPESTSFVSVYEGSPATAQWDGGLSEPTAVWDGANVQMFAIAKWRPAGIYLPTPTVGAVIPAPPGGSFKWVIHRWTAPGADVLGEFTHSPAFPVFDPEYDIALGGWGQYRGDVIHPHVMHDSANALLHMFIKRGQKVGHFVSPAPASDTSVWGAHGTWIANPNNPILTLANINAAGVVSGELTFLGGPFAWIDTTASKMVVGCMVNATGAGGGSSSFVLAETAWPTTTATRDLPTAMARHAATLLKRSHWAETVDYIPATGGGPYTIKALVKRTEPDTRGEHSRARLRVAEVWVRKDDDATIGVQQPSERGDKVDLVMRRGEASVRGRVTSVIREYPGLWVLEVTGVTISVKISGDEVMRLFRRAPALMAWHLRDQLEAVHFKHRKEWIARTQVQLSRSGKAGPVVRPSGGFAVEKPNSKKTVPGSPKARVRTFFFRVYPGKKKKPGPGFRGQADLDDIRSETFSHSEAALGLEEGGTFRAKRSRLIAVPIGVTLDSLGRPKSRWVTPKAYRAAREGNDLVALRLPGRKLLLYQVKGGKKAAGTSGAREITVPNSRRKRYLLPAYALVPKIRRRALLRYYDTWDALSGDRNKRFRRALSRTVEDLQRG